MMERNRRKIGSIFEKAAGAHLESRGMRILVYNYRCRSGEIDIIAQDKEYLVFCEVKYRSRGSVAHPLEAVNFKKQSRIRKCAAFYLLKTNQTNVLCRFDVIGILGKELIHIENAYMAR